MIRELRYILAVLIGVSMMSSCADEPLVSGYGDIPEGHATVSAKVSFKPFGSALNGDSRTVGDAIKEIKSLYVVLFDAYGEWIETFDATTQSDYKEVSESRDKNQTGLEDKDIAEKETPCATFKKTLSYGKYKIYVVANHTLDLNKQYTIDELRSINLEWDTSMGKNKNNQMFGYFTNGKTNSKPNGWDAPEITIASPTVNLHAWIRRAASKVTVAYDGSKLNENVYITIKSVQIKDIPKSCLLGKDYAAQTADGLIKDGEIIKYTASDNNNDGPVITKGGVSWGTIHIEGWTNPYDPSDTNGEAHKETSQALYFYENLQGKGESNTSSDKSVQRLEYKDKGKPNGTYIEVNAYYENKNLEDVSSGDIIYRFMLGKDVTIDYNAERNYHYKLTLCFNKDANDVDWRIDYDEEPGIYVPNPYYISYLYSEDMQMPLKLVIGQDDKVKELKAEIIENNWEPDGNTAALGTDYYGNENTIYSAQGANGVVNGTIGQGNTNIPWLGFLSLKDEYKLNDNKAYLDGGFGTDANLYIPSEKPYNWWTNQKLGEETYTSTKEEVTGTDTKSVLYSIPFYTRVKQLYSVSGFTGNNPYVGYNRTARVKFTATTEGGGTYVQEVKIIQVKRLVNPSGIWRDKNNTTPFNVVLKEQDGYGGDFKDLVSDGPWTATVKATTDGNWFAISPDKGVTGSKVAFTYTPEGVTSSPRCGIIEVKYHNETCSHLIFVRQGYEPIAIHQNGKKWYSFNMKTKDAMTTSPLDEGSLYRYGRWGSPIAESNNLDPKFGYGVNPGDNKFTLEGGAASKSWTEIGSSSRSTNLLSPISGTKVASEDDWLALKNGLQGYGVLYGDGATEVASTTTKTFGYRAAYQGNDKDERGMRGVFAYNENTGANVFFPIGAMGYGHRKQAHTTSSYGYGILRYGTLNALLPSNAAYRPMLYDLYAQNGAVYWTSTNGNAWDINFNQLDFNTYEYDNAWTNSYTLSDACFVRLVAD